jgi:acyl carrier protein
MSVRDKVQRFVLENFYVVDSSRITDEISLLDNGIIDSTGVLEVISFLEGEFGIMVEDEEIVPENLDSIARIAGFVHGKTTPALIPAAMAA